METDAKLASAKSPSTFARYITIMAYLLLGISILWRLGEQGLQLPEFMTKPLLILVIIAIAHTFSVLLVGIIFLFQKRWYRGLICIVAALAFVFTVANALRNLD